MIGHIIRTLSVLVCGLMISGGASAQTQGRWSGPYVGVHIGGAWGEFINRDTNPPNTTCWWCSVQYGDDTSGVLGGGTAGYNLIFGNFLLGIEGELSLSSIDGSAVEPVHLVPTTEVDTELLGAIAARLGVTVDQFLLYAKIGWGFARNQVSWTDTDYSSSAKGEMTSNGLVLGGGVEVAFSEGFKFKVEYLHFDVNDTEILDVRGYCCGYQQLIETDDIDTVKVGVIFSLGD